jgi:RimJ/RimL family protein N-acetyltransferase
MDGYLREAEAGDVDLLYEWVNDATTRQSSFDSHIISYEEHTNWFQKVLKDKNTYQYIYIRQGVPVGQVRVKVKNDVAELGYSIAPEYRMMGYGKEIIFLVKNLICSEHKQVRKIIANVKPENIGSKKMLLDNGFTEEYVAFSYQVNSTKRT